MKGREGWRGNGWDGGMEREWLGWRDGEGMDGREGWRGNGWEGEMEGEWMGGRDGRRERKLPSLDVKALQQLVGQ